MKMAKNKKLMSTRLAKDAFSNLFKKRATHKYPEVPAVVAEGFRGRQVLHLENCVGCTLCAKDCPTKAIEFIAYGGKKRPLIHLEKCVFCYQCADTCQKNVFEKSKFFELAVIDKSTLLLKPQPPAHPAPAPSETSSAPPTSPAKEQPL
jgi:formate hydrogenlyase subunit 6/NADH:ubiquinone oxidoreductase subunit I